ncbi:MAG TPA: peptidoglycan DD-metalloendopeptidase family protein [Candidatus Paceibacterota bacterium]|nr:peptidoglycan DD-metalloendopeptidase family protein [Candidatus Paceibacterota bacterium]
MHAQTATELNSKISEKNSDIDALEKEIASYQNQLNTIGKQKSSLSSSINQLDITKKKLNADIAVTQKKIEKTNLEIKSLSSQIGTKEGLIANDKSSISSGIRTINEVETESLIEIVLSRDSFTNAWNDIDNIVSVREKVRDRITELKQIKGELEDTRKVTESAKKELESLKAELADQKKIVEQNANEKKRLLAQTKNSESNYQKLLKEKLAKKEAFEKELLEYESQLKFILDPSLLPSGHVLNWPLDSIYITGYFSKTGANKALYSNGFHNGVDFRASVGTPVKAMADGTILGVGDTDKVCSGASFGKFVFIKYSNGLSSIYGHLSLIKVSQGQKVARGEIVGYSGNTGYSTGPHLHVSVYASSAVKMQYRASTACGGQTYYMPISATEGYLNPLTYLPVYKQ